MSIPRLRMIGGPNGSGKSTLLADLVRRNLPLGRVLNPDLMQQEILKVGFLDFDSLGIFPSPEGLRVFIDTHALAGQVETRDWRMEGGLMRFPGEKPGGYLTSVLADFIRRQWLESRQPFTFETVMSHPSKLDVLDEAKKLGYRTYLYFVCTEMSNINVARVANRVSVGGHDVDPKKIVDRYERVLALLPSAIVRCDRAFLFDNSVAKTPIRFVAEFENQRLLDAPFVPDWLVRAVPSIF